MFLLHKQLQSGYYDVKMIDENFIGFGGQSVHATKKGKQKNFARQTDGKMTQRVLKLVKYCPEVTNRLISITAEMEKEGVKLSSNANNNIVMTYPNGDIIAFDRKVRTPSGWIPGVDVISNLRKLHIMALKRNLKLAKQKFHC